MSSDRRIAIASLFIKIAALILIILGAYFVYKNASKQFKEIMKTIDNESFKQTFDKLKSIFNPHLKFLVMLGVGILLAALTFVLDLLVLSMSSWKYQTFGKMILFLSTLFPLPLWLLSWMGNIGIAIKKKEA